MTEDALDRAVARTVEERTGRRARWARACFRGHATWFVIVNLGLFAIWLADWAIGGEEEPWFLYPLLGWGVALLAHWVSVRPAFRRTYR